MSALVLLDMALERWNSDCTSSGIAEGHINFVGFGS